MSPQCHVVLKHLSTHLSKGITGVEAEQVYRIRHLPRRIADLKDSGYDIATVRKVDPTGQRYSRYFLKDLNA